MSSPAELVGRASWYGPGFFGHKRSDGKPYLASEVFVAHRSYPLGTVLRITNLRNHRTVIAPVEDRGPYKRGRVLDLSYEAARELDMVKAGIVFVSYDEVGTATAQNF